MHTRTHIVALARDWLGTPYHHQASLRGVGTDCLGLVRGIYREFHGTEAQTLPAYTRDWAEGSGRETLLEAARRHLVEIAPFDAQPGDVLVFRWRRTTLAKHCAVLSKPTAMIHALEGAPVTEVALTPWWRRHTAGVFVFPVLDPAMQRSPSQVDTKGAQHSSLRACEERSGSGAAPRALVGPAMFRASVAHGQESLRAAVGGNSPAGAEFRRLRGDRSHYGRRL